MNKKKLNIGERIKELVSSRFESNELFAKKIGVSEATVYNWFRGEDVKASRVVELSDFFGVSVHWLITGQNPGDWKSSEYEIKNNLLSNNKAGGDQVFFSQQAQEDLAKKYQEALDEIKSLRMKLDAANDTIRELSLSIIRNQEK